MTETRCRWDREHSEYRTPDGDTCDTPKRDHCQTRKCPNHLPWGELTCTRCLHRTRTNIRHIAQRSALLMTAALESRRINSEAANLAGPACDVEAWSWRKVAAMQGKAFHVSLVDEDDDRHPFTVLTYWAWQTAGAYGLPEPDVYTIANAAELLDKQLHRIANDEGQDFDALASEVRACRNHLDTALSLRDFPERGVPCPTCQVAAVQDRVNGVRPRRVDRLVREYPEFCRCENDGCARLHVADDSLDVWVCPRNREHWWSHKDYTNRLEDRKASA